MVSACGAGGGPEKVVRDFIAAINARNYAKAREYVSPDKRDDYEQVLEGYKERGVKYPTIREIVVRDSIWPDEKIVTVILTKSYLGGEPEETEDVFYVEKLKGRWYISSVPPWY